MREFPDYKSSTAQSNFAPEVVDCALQDHAPKKKAINHKREGKMRRALASVLEI